MNGPQDVGGRHGFGPVAPEPDEPLFHAEWEARALALTVAAGAAGHWSIDESRFARENRSPAEYYRLSYYQIWIAGLTRLLLDKGLVTGEELASGQAGDRETVPPNRRLGAEEVAAVLSRGAPASRDPQGRRPAFSVGDRVRTRNLQPAGHTRLPSYARGKTGRIASVHGFHVFADASARGDHAAAEWLYAVVFDARELWGGDARAGDEVVIDAWEPYLDPC